jgi:hypothetical protein
MKDTCFNASDLRSDGRWPEFGRRCAEQTGVISMLSIRLFTEADTSLVAGLNMYSHQAGAFNETSEAMANLIAIHGAAAVGKATAETKSRNLLVALKNSREIGVAMGIIMAYEKVTREQASTCCASPANTPTANSLTSQQRLPTPGRCRN